MKQKPDEEKILVMFPAAKNFPSEDHKGGDFVSKAIKEAKKLEVKSSIPKHVDLQQGKRASVRMSLDELIEVVDSQVELLKENTRRMKYYLDEIEFFSSDPTD